MAGEWWSGVELRHLVALDAVAREGSFRRAATRLGYVQSAISHQIAALENLTGKRLIDRSRGTRPLALTDAGEIMLAHADAVIARIRAAQADLAALDGNGNAALRVGATPDLLARLVPSLLRVYGAPVTLNENSSTVALLTSLVRGEIDLALAETPLPKGPLDAAALCTDPFVVMLQSGAPLTRHRKPVTREELARLPLVATHLRAHTWKSSSAPTASNRTSSSRRKREQACRDWSQPGSEQRYCHASRPTNAGPRRRWSSSPRV